MYKVKCPNHSVYHETRLKISVGKNVTDNSRKYHCLLKEIFLKTTVINAINMHQHFPGKDTENTNIQIDTYSDYARRSNLMIRILYCEYSINHYLIIILKYKCNIKISAYPPD